MDVYIHSTYRYVYATVYKGYSYFRVAPECRRGKASRITFLSWCACFFFSFSFRNTKTDGWTPHPSLDDGRKKASADEFHFKPLHLVPLSLFIFALAMRSNLWSQGTYFMIRFRFQQRLVFWWRPRYLCSLFALIYVSTPNTLSPQVADWG